MTAIVATRCFLYSIMPTVGTHELWLDGVRLVQ